MARLQPYEFILAAITLPRIRPIALILVTLEACQPESTNPPKLPRSDRLAGRHAARTYPAIFSRISSIIISKPHQPPAVKPMLEGLARAPTGSSKRGDGLASGGRAYTE